MKKFIRFEFDQYYPCGGMHDLVGDFDSMDEALAHRSSLLGPNDKANFVQIVDRDTWEVLAREDNR